MSSSFIPAVPPANPAGLGWDFEFPEAKLALLRINLEDARNALNSMSGWCTDCYHEKTGQFPPLQRYKEVILERSCFNKIKPALLARPGPYNIHYHAAWNDFVNDSFSQIYYRASHKTRRSFPTRVVTFSSCAVPPPPAIAAWASWPRDERTIEHFRNMFCLEDHDTFHSFVECVRRYADISMTEEHPREWDCPYIYEHARFCTSFLPGRAPAAPNVDLRIHFQMGIWFLTRPIFIPYLSQSSSLEFQALKLVLEKESPATSPAADAEDGDDPPADYSADANPQTEKSEDIDEGTGADPVREQDNATGGHNDETGADDGQGADDAPEEAGDSHWAEEGEVKPRAEQQGEGNDGEQQDGAGAGTQQNDDAGAQQDDGSHQQQQDDDEDSAGEEAEEGQNDETDQDRGDETGDHNPSSTYTPRFTVNPVQSFGPYQSNYYIANPDASLDARLNETDLQNVPPHLGETPPSPRRGRKLWNLRRALGLLEDHYFQGYINALKNYEFGHLLPLEFEKWHAKDKDQIIDYAKRILPGPYPERYGDETRTEFNELIFNIIHKANHRRHAAALAAYNAHRDAARALARVTLNTGRKRALEEAHGAEADTLPDVKRRGMIEQAGFSQIVDSTMSDIFSGYFAGSNGADLRHVLHNRFSELVHQGMDAVQICDMLQNEAGAYMMRNQAQNQKEGSSA